MHLQKCLTFGVHITTFAGLIYMNFIGFLKINILIERSARVFEKRF